MSTTHDILRFVQGILVGVMLSVAVFLTVLFVARKQSGSGDANG